MAIRRGICRISDKRRVYLKPVLLWNSMLLDVQPTYISINWKEPIHHRYHRSQRARWDKTRWDERTNDHERNGTPIERAVKKERTERLSLRPLRPSHERIDKRTFRSSPTRINLRIPTRRSREGNTGDNVPYFELYCTVGINAPCTEIRKINATYHIVRASTYVNLFSRAKRTKILRNETNCLRQRVFFAPFRTWQRPSAPQKALRGRGRADAKIATRDGENARLPGVCSGKIFYIGSARSRKRKHPHPARTENPRTAETLSKRMHVTQNTITRVCIRV